MEEIISKLLLSLVAILLSYMIGKLLSTKGRKWLRVVIRKREIKEHIENERITIRLVEMIITFIEYLIYIAGIIVALSLAGLELSNTLISAFLSFVPNLIIALIILLTGWMVSIITRKAVEISLSSSGVDELFRELGRSLLPSSLVGIFVQYIIIIVAFIIALSQLGLQTQLLAWITLATTTLLTFFVLLIFYSSIKPFLPDIVAGVLLRNAGYVKIGQYLLYNGEKYRIKEIGVVMALLEREKDKAKVRIRNSKIVEKIEELGEK